MALNEDQKKILKVALAAKDVDVDAIIAQLDKVAGAVEDLGQDISASYDEAEVQAISDKVDEMLAALRAAGIMES